jgi:hypothetical protein
MYIIPKGKVRPSSSSVGSYGVLLWSHSGFEVSSSQKLVDAIRQMYDVAAVQVVSLHGATIRHSVDDD